MNFSFASLTGRQIVLLVLLVLAVVPYVLGLGASSLWDANEAFYAETARQMVETGDYVNPSFNAEPRFNKPVLPYWIVAVSYHAFGVSEKAERIPIAAAALVLIAVAYRLGSLQGSRTAGLAAAVVLATSPRFLMFARRIIIDVHLAAFAGLALLFFALSEAYPGRRRSCLVLMYVATALGTLTKGPVAVLVPGLAILLYLAWERRLRDVRNMLMPVGAAIGAAIILPWYVLVYQEHGWQYIQSFVLVENLGRYTQSVAGEGRGVLFYPPVVLDHLFPWSLFVPFALWGGVRHLWSADDEASGGRIRDAPATVRNQGMRRTLRLLVCWIVVFVGFFSLSRTKQDLYILPIVPAVAALVGAMLAAAVDGGGLFRLGRYVRPVAAATGVVLFFAGAALLVALAVPGAPSLAGVGLAAATLAAGGLATVVLTAGRRNFEAVAAIGASLMVVSWLAVWVMLPDFERYKPVRPLAEAIDDRAGSAAVIGSYRLGIPSLVYYLRRPVVDMYAPGQIIDLFSSDADVYVVITEHDYRQIQPALPVGTYAVDRRPWLNVHLGSFLAGEATQSVLLVSNRRP